MDIPARSAHDDRDGITPTYIHEFIGTLGWLDTDLPLQYYGWGAYFSGFLHCLRASAGRIINPPSLLARVLIFVVVLGAIVAIYAALYITWSAPGGAVISGVQGRYFIPPLLVAGLAFSGAWTVV